MSATTDWLQVGLLAVNAGLIYKYLRETMRTRSAAENQVTKTQELVEAGQRQVTATYEQTTAI